MKILLESSPLATSRADLQTEKKIATAAWQALLARSDLGFLRIADRSRLWEQSEVMGQELRREFRHLVVVGLGGSSMGARLFKDVFSETNSSHHLHICDNVDPFATERLARALPLRETAWVIVSKSGKTIETVVLTEWLQDLLENNNLLVSHHVRLVTELEGAGTTKNSLLQWAKKMNVKSADLPEDIGGRFSVLTPVGLVPAVFMGCRLEDLRSGVQKALQNQELVTSIAAHSLKSFSDGKSITLFWSYSSLLREFGGWLSQLWAESLGKSKDRAGQPAPRVSTPITAVGACDQHSIFQQVMDGAHDKFVIFQRVHQIETHPWRIRNPQVPGFEFLKGHGLGQLLGVEAQATALALTEVGVPNLTLELPDLSAQTVGQLLMFWQLVVGVLGEALNINAFDQPGVELGKKLANELLRKTNDSN